MKSFLGVDFLICSIVLTVALVEYSKAQDENNKNRRAQGLIAYPRVGRSDPNLINNLHEIEPSALETIYQASLEDYEDYPKNEIKRANLMAFPRVGRNDAEIRKWARLLALQQALDKRTGPSATSGLWFGPRLGKRSINNANAHGEENHAKQAGQKEIY